MDPEDPTVIAENELLGAAAAIEAAAKKLEQLKPRAKPKVSPAPFSSAPLSVCTFSLLLPCISLCHFCLFFAGGGRVLEL